MRCYLYGKQSIRRSPGMCLLLVVSVRAHSGWKLKELVTLQRGHESVQMWLKRKIWTSGEPYLWVYILSLCSEKVGCEFCSEVLLYPFKSSGHYMYRQFNIKQFYVLPTQCTYVFCVDLRTNSNYFPIQRWLTGFYNRDLTLQSPVVTICTTSLTLNSSTFCPHSVLMCFVWISEETAIISLFSVHWLGFITEI